MALLDAIYMVQEDQETLTKEDMYERTYVMAFLLKTSNPKILFDV